MVRMKLSRVSAGVALVLAASAICASGASAAASLELKAEGKPLSAGGEVLLVAGYSLGGCYWEEQEFKVTSNRAGTDRLARTGEAGQYEGCTGGAKSIEITAARKMTVKLAPLRIHLEGGCVYEFKEVSGRYAQTEWGPEISGNATGRVNAAQSLRTAKCAKTRTTFFDVALSGLETVLTG